MLIVEIIEKHNEEIKYHMWSHCPEATSVFVFKGLAFHHVFLFIYF